MPGSGIPDLGMVFELVQQGFRAVVAGGAVHDALGPVGIVALGLMAFATAAHGGLHGEGTLVVLALFDLGLKISTAL